MDQPFRLERSSPLRSSMAGQAESCWMDELSDCSELHPGGVGAVADPVCTTAVALELEIDRLLDEAMTGKSVPSGSSTSQMLIEAFAR